ncbi:MAG: hypothetical protein LBK47_01805 [Prevotellaceae bacterium]|nr:hypothetical protein [Prevotellaceae bacterium]
MRRLYKKVTILFCVGTLLQVVMIAGCDCIPLIYSSQLTGIIATCEKDFQQQLDNTLVDVDSFRIKCVLHGSSYQRPRYAFYHSFCSTAMATTRGCEDEDLQEGLTVKVTDIELRCNRKLWSTESGEPLDTNLFFFQDYLYATNFSKEDYLYELNTLGKDGNGRSIFYLKFKEKFDTQELLKFTVVVVLEDGTKLSSETGSVRER